MRGEHEDTGQPPPPPPLGPLSGTSLHFRLAVLKLSVNSIPKANLGGTVKFFYKNLFYEVKCSTYLLTIKPYHTATVTLFLTVIGCHTFPKRPPAPWKRGPHARTALLTAPWAVSLPLRVYPGGGKAKQTTK